MNVNINIINRAFDKAGQEPLTEKELTEKTSTRWRLIKDIYLSTILETLNNTAWTSQTVRERLVLSERENLTDFAFMYELPKDCAKPISLKSDSIYVIEGFFLYTDDEEAILVYVSNGYTGEAKYELANPQPTAETFTAQTYYVYNEELETYVVAGTWTSDKEFYVQVQEDYMDYRDFDFDPLLSEYLETRLAAKIVLKLTGKTDLYQLLYNDSLLMENRAAKATKAHGFNKDKGNRLWTEILGLPGHEE